MFVLNLGVSFAVADDRRRAYDLPRDDLREMRRRLWHRLRTCPRDLPCRRAAARRGPPDPGRSPLGAGRR